MKRGKIMVLVAVLAAILCAAGSVRAAAGDMLWEQRFTFPGCDTIVISAMAASATKFIVCGTAFDSTIDTGDIGFIKVFDQATGQPRDINPPLNTGNNRNSFNSIAVVGSTVVVEGYSSSYTIGPSPSYTITYTLNQTTLRAYNADTGALLWGPMNNSSAAIDIGPSNIVTANNRVFVVQQQNHHNDPPSNTGECIIQAYQANATNVSALPLLLE